MAATRGSGSRPSRRCYTSDVNAAKLTVQLEREEDGRWIAEVLGIPGALVYGQSRQEAPGRAQALALRVLADRIEHGEVVPELSGLFDAA